VNAKTEDNASDVHVDEIVMHSIRLHESRKDWKEPLRGHVAAGEHGK
jgi:hypothetical protein